MQSHNTAQPATGGPTDELLLSDVREGKLDSFGVLYERYVSMARAIAYKHTSNNTLSEDIVSEAFVRVLQALKNGKGPRTFMGGYLATTIAHLAAENGLIAQKEVPSEEEHLESMGSLDETVLKLHESDELISAFTGLPERWQTVLWMTEVEDKKPREVAQIMNLSANAVSALAARARESLREGFLRAHQNAPKTDECAQYSPHLSSMVRGSLTKKRSEALRLHLSVCSYCTSEYLTLAGINKSMRVWVFPVLAGLVPVITDGSKVLLPFLAGGVAGGAAAGAGVQSGLFSGLGGGRWTPGSQALAGAAAVVTAIGAVAGGMALVNNSSAGSAAISADSQLQTPKAQANEENSGVTDSLVNEPQNVSRGMTAETLRSSVAANDPSAVQGNNSANGGGSTNSLAQAAGSENATSQQADADQGANAAAPVASSGETESAVSTGNPSAPSQGNAASVAEPVAVQVPNANPELPGAPETPANPVEPSAPVAPSAPVDSAIPGEPVAPTDPVGPVAPAEPSTPEPEAPVVPSEPTDPAEPVEPTDPTVPVEPTDPTVPVEPVDPVDPTVPVEPTIPDYDSWLGSADYYQLIASIPWDAIGQPIGDNRMCMITFIVTDTEGANWPSGFATYLPPVLIESPYAAYLLEGYLGLSKIQDITCY
ncbi:sigma-70 family RNA polymerase sigma factor [Rothia nasimurium]|uniref:sigma-70 family RNA polymerase sigma factor n=1 Tax=Rothia nasimurium TaxID=85336 RepID=UPI001C89A986|nr:sigma-70 family RNA polymerase sigma factor [Rothia nasimurium]